MPDGSTETPIYPRTADALFAFCVDDAADSHAALRRLYHAQRDDGRLSRSVVTEVREAIWDRASRAHDGTIGRPPSSWVGVARPVQRRGV